MEEKDIEEEDQGTNAQKEVEVKASRLRYQVDQNGVVHNVKWLD